MMTTAQTAAALQVTRRRVLELIKLGTLHAEKFGRDWQVEESSVEAYKNSPRKAGRKKNISTHELSDMNTERNTNAIDRGDDSGNISL